MTFPQCRPFTEDEPPRPLPTSRAAVRYDRGNTERYTGWTDCAQPFDEAKARRMLPWLFVEPASDDEVAA